MIETFAENVSTHLRSEKQMAIPWEIVIELALELIERCFPSKNQTNDFLAAVKNPTILQRAAANVIARRATGLPRRESHAVAECMFHCCTKESEENLSAMHAECCAALGR